MRKIVYLVILSNILFLSACTTKSVTTGAIVSKELQNDRNGVDVSNSSTTKPVYQKDEACLRDTYHYLEEQKPIQERN